MAEMKKDEAPPSIKGNSLRVYLYVLKHDDCELREVQRGLQLSTPSLASYHLSRLVKDGYVEQTTDGKYKAVKDASSEILDGYAKLGATLVPQMFFFAVLFTILVAFFSYNVIYSPIYMYALVMVSVGAVATLWYETVRLWRRIVSWS